MQGASFRQRQPSFNSDTLWNVLNRSHNDHDNYDGLQYKLVHLAAFHFLLNLFGI
jgi:hypothetical protein